MRRDRLIVWLGAATLVATVTGCSVGHAADRVGYAGKVVMWSQDLGPTVTRTTGDHLHMINAVIDHDARALFDDLDMLYQTDRPTRLTRWIDR